MTKKPIQVYGHTALGVPEDVERRPAGILCLREADRLDPTLRRNFLIGLARRPVLFYGHTALGKTRVTERLAKKYGLKVKRLGRARRHA
jgi:MoxR-like ATPase